MSTGEKKLRSEKIAVIGLGLVGGYLVQRLSEKGYSVDVFEISNSSRLTEFDVEKKINIIGDEYKAASQGRFFGLGGTTHDWGGQLVFLDQGNSRFEKIIKKHKKKVLNFFGLKIKLNNKEGVNGVWLKSSKRSILNYIDKTNLNFYEENVISLKKNNALWTLQTKSLKTFNGYDKVFLCCGAFENCSIMYESGFLENEKVFFKDHVSTPLFEIQNMKPTIKNVDFTPILKYNGMLTKRINYKNKGFISIAFNEKIFFFKLLKKLLYNNENIQFKNIKIFKEIKFLFLFILNLFLGRLFVDRSFWRIIIDIEKQEFSSLNLSSKTINWTVDKSTKKELNNAQDEMENFLVSNGYNYSKLQIESEKLVDCYHPVAFSYANKKMLVDIDGKIFDNVYNFSTGILPFASYSNPSVNVLCLIEEYLNLNE